MEAFSVKFGNSDGTAASNWTRSDEWHGSTAASSSIPGSFVSYGRPSPILDPDFDNPKKKYDPFGAVELWAKPKRQKRPSAFVAFNQVPTQRPRKGRRGKH